MTAHAILLRSHLPVLACSLSSLSLKLARPPVGGFEVFPLTAGRREPAGRAIKELPVLGLGSADVEQVVGSMDCFFKSSIGGRAALDGGWMAWRAAAVAGVDNALDLIEPVASSLLGENIGPADSFVRPATTVATGFAERLVVASALAPNVRVDVTTGAERAVGPVPGCGKPWGREKAGRPVGRGCSSSDADAAVVTADLTLPPVTAGLREEGRRGAFAAVGRGAIIDVEPERDFGFKHLCCVLPGRAEGGALMLLLETPGGLSCGKESNVLRSEATVGALVMLEALE